MILISAGKHYINPDEISTIQCVEVILPTIRIHLGATYEFAMKNGIFLKISQEDFIQFKVNYERMINNVFQM